MNGVISTSDQVVKIRTRRGVLTVGPHGRLGGLWRIVNRELRTNAQVRAMCAGTGARGRHSTKPVTLATLRRWRETAAFPEPVYTVKTLRPTLELWARSDVEDWLAARSGGA